MDTNDAPIRDALLGAAGGLAGLAALRLYWAVAGALPGEDPRARVKKGAKKEEMGERDVAAQQRQRRAEMAAAEEAPDDWNEEHAPLFPPPRLTACPGATAPLWAQPTAFSLARLPAATYWAED